MGSISHHIMPLVSNNLRVGHTHTLANTHTCIYVDIHGQKQF